MKPGIDLRLVSALSILFLSSPQIATATAKPRVKTVEESTVSALADTTLAPKLEKWTGEPITQGNDIKLMVFGHEFFPKRLQIIREARHTIDFQSYLWCDDESGLAVAKALAAASRRGVRVRLIMDWTNVMDHDEAYSTMESAGIELLKYNSAFWGIKDVNKRLHEKLMIVDGQEILIGGANMCNEYLLDTPAMPLWQDLEFDVKGPAVSRMQKQFDSDWNWMATLDVRARMRAGNLNKVYTIYHEPTPATTEAVGTSRALILHQQPYRRPGEGARFAEMLSAFVRSAKKDLVLYVPYLAPNPLFKKAIVDTAKRGVKVRIFTNSEETNDMAFILANAALTHYGELLQAGVRIFERDKSTLHAKAILVDGKTLTVGSHNFTHRSFSENGEANIMTDDTQAIGRFQRMVTENMAEFTEITPRMYLNRINGTGEQGGLIIGRWLEKLF